MQHERRHELQTNLDDVKCLRTVRENHITRVEKKLKENQTREKAGIRRTLRQIISMP